MGKLNEQEFQAYLKQIRELAEGKLDEMQKDIEVTNVFPEEFYQICIKNNLYRCSVPVEYGGWGLSELEILKIQEEFSRGPGGMRMHLHYAMDLNWRPLYDFGTEELKKELMPGFQDRTVFTCWAVTEETGGTGADIQTRAVRDGDDYIINGEKFLISHTDCCNYAYITVLTDPNADKDHRLSTFMVPCNTPGYEVTPMPHMMGCRGAGHTGLKFTNMRVNKKYLLGKEGDGLHISIHSLSVSRAHIAASNLGMAQRMLEISLKRAHDRVTFGKPIIERQAIRMKIADMATHVHALRTMVYDFAKDYEKDPHGEYIEEKAAMCKLFSIQVTKVCGDEMLEIFGGIGYFEDCEYGPVERLYRDSRAMWLEEGTPTVQRITISRQTVKHGGRLEYLD
ncbi:acyl-CoA dehydrogenase family protein [Sporomusa acidovorans]|uniref:Acyl-CoA dehydrogenase n=1 Tax=Sporomusa acidovorans (strain ATCC 49682 / DSM 3132 / Mol) TaxID=1123286 RepID=A0ABZ3IZV8_SPOA4|nr:acyl-CoA dehydrogenase family protein [Sporomusa acidovorans]OZC21380.1 acyl-CoA dehydrogenase [Sporomusa acidovorans DSM 3132]SDE55770.1 Acyl-CoA dehydrogenase [Sporomusa acidovorans]